MKKYNNWRSRGQNDSVITQLTKMFVIKTPIQIVNKKKKEFKELKRIKIKSLKTLNFLIFISEPP